VDYLIAIIYGDGYNITPFVYIFLDTHCSVFFFLSQFINGLNIGLNFQKEKTMA